MALKPLELLGAVLGAYLFFKWAGGALSDRFSVSYAGMRPRGFDLEGLKLEVRIRMRNETPASLPVDGVSGILKYMGAGVANFSVPTSFSIPANGETTQTVNVTIPIQNVTGAVEQVLTSGNFTTSFQLVGQVISGGVVFPFSANVNPLPI